MGWLEFIAALTSSLAWPLVAVVSLLVLRKHVVTLFAKVTKLTMPGIEAEFRSGLEMVEARTVAEAREAVKAQDDRVLYSIAAPAPVLERDPLALLANPTGVIMEAWKELEASIRDLLIRTGLGAGVTMPPVSNTALRSLLESEFLSDGDFRSIQELRELRNMAAHETGRTITSVDAERFRSIVEAIIRRLDRDRASAVDDDH